MDKYIGTMLDNRYELLEIIGVGGTAVVYKAKCHRLNRYVAVKILKGEAKISEMAIEYAPATKKFNKEMCELLGINVPEGYEEMK